MPNDIMNNTNILKTQTKTLADYKVNAVTTNTNKQIEYQKKKRKKESNMTFIFSFSFSKSKWGSPAKLSHLRTNQITRWETRNEPNHVFMVSLWWERKGRKVKTHKGTPLSLSMVYHNIEQPFWAFPFFFFELGGASTTLMAESKTAFTFWKYKYIIIIL